MAQGSKGQILSKNQDFRKQLEIAIFEFCDFLREVRTLKAFQTGIKVALSKYLFYGQLGGQKGSKVYVCLEFCQSHFLSRGPLVLRGLFTTSGISSVYGISRLYFLLKVVVLLMLYKELSFLFQFFILPWKVLNFICY